MTNKLILYAIHVSGQDYAVVKLEESYDLETILQYEKYFQTDKKKNNQMKQYLRFLKDNDIEVDLYTYKFSTKEDREIAHELIKDTVQTCGDYDTSKHRNVFIILDD